MSGGVAPVPFQLGIRDFNFSSDSNVRSSKRLVFPIVGDSRIGLATSDVDFIRIITIRLAATRRTRKVWPHQILEPLPSCRIRVFPLPEVTGLRSVNGAKDDAQRDNDQHPNDNTDGGSVFISLALVHVNNPCPCRCLAL